MRNEGRPVTLLIREEKLSNVRTSELKNGTNRVIKREKRQES